MKILPNFTNSLKDFFKDWLVFLVSAVFVAAALIVFLWPGFWDYKAKREELGKNKILLNEEIAPKIQVLENQNKTQLSDYLLTLELLVPSMSNPASLFTIIEDSAARNNLKISVLSLTGIVDSPDKKEVNLSLTTAGSESDLLVLADSLSANAPIIKIAKLTVLGSPDPTQKSLSLSLSSPFLAIPKSLGEVGQPVSGLSASDKNILDALKKDFLDPRRLNQGTVVPTPLPFGKTNPF